MEIGIISYSIGFIAFLLLTAWLLKSWQGQWQGGLLALATAISTVWLALAVYHQHSPSPLLLHLLEVARNISWFIFLLSLLHQLSKGGWLDRALRPIIYVISIALLLLFVTEFATYRGLFNINPKLDIQILEYLLCAVFGLVLVEQVYRNTRAEERWGLKFLCLGLGAIFAYDFFLYSNALLLRNIDITIWEGRGFTNALVIPLIALSAARNPQWSLNVFVSRSAVFHTAALLGAGSYLLVMAAAGYYIRSFGGTWGGVIQVLFLFGAIILLIVMLFSGQLRASVKVFFNKHFFNYNYDYRAEWLRFMRTIALEDEGYDLQVRSIRAIAQIIDSPGGVLWLNHNAGSYRQVAHWNMPDENKSTLSEDCELVQFMTQRGWVIDLEEMRQHPDKYNHLDVPQWLRAKAALRIIVPLIHNERLLGFILLARPRADREINWEDLDLLKTVGYQAAGYLELMLATEALLEARQFDAFNRLSAYVVHDLKNVVAQLALVVANAARHKNNPEFIDDALKTVENAVNKMNHMLAQLRKGDRGGAASIELVRLDKILQEACQARSAQQPVPRLDIRCDSALVAASRDRIGAIFEHIIQNAQDATADDGSIDVVLWCQGNQANVEIKDSGCGMSDEFMRQHLFKPFVTTKGNAGMGIGVYETRDYVTSLGGHVDVTSEEAVGTSFRISLPLKVLAHEVQESDKPGEVAH